MCLGDGSFFDILIESLCAACQIFVGLFVVDGHVHVIRSCLLIVLNPYFWYVHLLGLMARMVIIDF